MKTIDKISSKPTNGQLISSCISVRHDFGLLEASQQDDIKNMTKIYWTQMHHLSQKPGEILGMKPTDKQVEFIKEKVYPMLNHYVESEKQMALFEIQEYWYAIFKEIAEPSWLAKGQT